MSENEKTRDANDTSWYSGKVTRRRLIGSSPEGMRGKRSGRITSPITA